MTEREEIDMLRRQVADLTERVQRLEDVPGAPENLFDITHFRANRYQSATGVGMGPLLTGYVRYAHPDPKA